MRARERLRAEVEGRSRKAVSRTVSLEGRVGLAYVVEGGLVVLVEFRGVDLEGTYVWRRC